MAQRIHFTFDNQPFYEADKSFWRHYTIQEVIYNQEEEPAPECLVTPVSSAEQAQPQQQTWYSIRISNWRWTKLIPCRLHGCKPDPKAATCTVTTAPSTIAEVRLKPSAKSAPDEEALIPASWPSLTAASGMSFTLAFGAGQVGPLPSTAVHSCRTGTKSALPKMLKVMARPFISNNASTANTSSKKGVSMGKQKLHWVPKVCTAVKRGVDELAYRTVCTRPQLPCV